MKKTIDKWDMKKAFVECDRDYFTVDGLEAILNYYNEIDENIELDVIGICCECSEYGEHGTALNFDDLINDYSNLLDGEITEWNKNSLIKQLINELEKYTVVLNVRNGNYIVFNF